MKLIKTLGNKPRAPATLTDVLIGGQVLPICHRMCVWPQGCSQMSAIHDRVRMNKGHVLPLRSSHMTHKWLWKCLKAVGHTEQVNSNDKGTTPAVYGVSRGEGSVPL